MANWINVNGTHVNLDNVTHVEVATGWPLSMNLDEARAQGETFPIARCFLNVVVDGMQSWLDFAQEEREIFWREFDKATSNRVGITPNFGSPEIDANVLHVKDSTNNG